MNRILHSIFYVLLASTAIATAHENKLGKIPAFRIEPEYQPLITSTSKVSSILINQTNSFESSDRTEINQSPREQNQIYLEDIEQVNIISLYAMYVKNKQLTEMIDALFTPLEYFVSQTLDQVEAVVGTCEVFNEESATLLKKTAADLLGLPSLRTDPITLEESEDPSYLEEIAEYDEWDEDVINNEAITLQSIAGFNAFLSTPAGKNLMNIFDLYHLILYELAMQECFIINKANPVSLTFSFKNLEAQFMKALDPKYSKFNENEVTNVQSLRTIYVQALAAGREFLVTKQNELWAIPLSIARAIATKVNRPVEDLVLIDFISAYNTLVAPA